VVAEQADCVVLLREVDNRVAIGPAVYQIAEENKAVTLLQLEQLEQLSEFLIAAVDVADGDYSFITQVSGLFASVLPLVK
jgi:hypothetical protein